MPLQTSAYGVEGGGTAELEAVGDDSLAAALNGLREGLFLCDAGGCLTYANAALSRLRGGLPDDPGAAAAIGRHWGTLFVEESRRRIEREGLPALLAEGHWRGGVALRSLDGPPCPVVLSLSAGRRGGLVGLATAEAAPPGEPERMARAEARGERLEALRRLAGDMAHDLNNVLTSIVGYARFLSEDLPKDAPQHGFAEQILVATQRARQVIDDALSFARGGRGDRKPVAIGPAVEQAATDLRPLLPPGSSLSLGNIAAEPTVEAEPEAFAAVLRQLLANAAEASEGRPARLEVDWGIVGELPDLPGLGKPGDKAGLSIERGSGARLRAAAGVPDPHGRFLQLSVRDQGGGMTPEVLEHAFEPFFTTRQPSKGRGLGLAAVFGQVLGHGGALTVDTAAGEGTTVTLYWPASPSAAIARAAAGAADSAAPARRQLPRGSGQRILVAEDDRVLREAIGEMLQRLGYRPVLVSDGEVARRVLADGGEIEAVMTDRRMPNLSGTDLIGWMRAEGLRQPVLLCTGYGEDLDTRTLTRAGSVAVLSKPINAATLASSLDALLSGQAG